MKTIGILGGLSPESTVKYYQWLNDGAKAHLGGNHSAKILLSSVDFGHFCELKMQGNWEERGRLIVEEAKALERAGADFIILASNTTHNIAPMIEAAITIPFLHIADPTARSIQKAGMETVGLLATQPTMEMDFYKTRLKEKFAINAIVPAEEADRETIENIIFKELVNGIVNDESRTKLKPIMAALTEQGAQGIILGCTELTLLVKPEDSPVPLFDTTRIHVEEALKMMFN